MNSERKPHENKIFGMAKSIGTASRRVSREDYELIAQEMYAKNLELARINQILSALRSIDLIILQSRATFAGLTREMSEAIIDVYPYSFVGILSVARPNDASVGFRGWAVGEEHKNISNLDSIEKQISSLTFSLGTPWMNGSGGAALLDLLTADAIQLHELGVSSKSAISSVCAQLGVGSVCAVRLLARGSVVGVMIVGLESAPAEADVDFIMRLSESVGVAIDNKLLLDEIQRFTKRLSQANMKLQKLDETKDEFISMASHQLRTPLTSIKGYLSMVLEGDAGEVNPTQRKMLDQAFVSSQRMVALIADLLNVSRLRTGKFVIEPSMTNLADVVKGEVAQLKETAAGRHLDLDCVVPPSFPLLYMDETKTRQVVMNFIDNAIYYTPAGGHITVKLTETAAAIEFSVTDDGIGVPRSEQYHLFTKFYRAGNARKARPDGTGLGLFMAKKVIVAQGGAVLFKSRSGKGSMFGFTFSKAKLQLPTSKP